MSPLSPLPRRGWTPCTSTPAACTSSQAGSAGSASRRRAGSAPAAAATYCLWTSSPPLSALRASSPSCARLWAPRALCVSRLRRSRTRLPWRLSSRTLWAPRAARARPLCAVSSTTQACLCAAPLGRSPPRLCATLCRPRSSVALCSTSSPAASRASTSLLSAAPSPPGRPRSGRPSTPQATHTCWALSPSAARPDSPPPLSASGFSAASA